MASILVIGNPPRKGNTMKNVQKIVTTSASGILGAGASNMLGDLLARSIIGTPKDASGLRNANLVSASAGIVGAAGMFYLGKSASQKTKSSILHPMMAGMIVSSGLKLVGTFAPEMAKNFVNTSAYESTEDSRLQVSDFLYPKNLKRRGMGNYTKQLIDRARKSAPYGAMDGGLAFQKNAGQADFLYPTNL